jgi:tRNA uridine 5-carboxymethylaminomethyl modification enzyme
LKKVTISALDKIIDKNKISLHIHPEEKNRIIKFLPEFGERFRLVDVPPFELIQNVRNHIRTQCIVNNVYGIIIWVDDLITLGTQEPYRMFTSRAEYRLLLREDNADQRLTELGRAFGLVDDARWAAYETKLETLQQEVQRLQNIWIYPAHQDAKRAEDLMQLPLSKEHKLFDLLRRPNVTYNALSELAVFGEGVSDPAVIEQIEIEAKYAGYIERQLVEIEKAKREETTPIPDDLDLDTISGLSNEVKQKLRQHKPATLGMASRISGITPAAISLLAIFMKKHRAAKAKLEQVQANA